MRILGLEITRAKDLSQVSGRGSYGSGSWWPVIREPWSGAWQHNRELRAEDITAFHAVFACITLIASDISKLRVKLIKEIDGVWQESNSPAYDAVLENPNHYQNRIQFWESWILSKLTKGNTYVLKGRDARNVVNRLFPLDPCRVRVLVSELGSVFYQLMDDNISGLAQSVTVPASEMIHDRMNCIYHPLCGIPPLYAAALAARQGLTIQRESLEFFDNRAIPGGILTSPTRITEQTVALMRSQWEQNFGGVNRGKIAVLGDGLKFEPMAVTATDAQLIETAKATAEWVCSVFHVPPYKIGVGPMPAYNNIQALNVEYYSQCLQSLIEAAEVSLDHGLELKSTIGVEFDIEGLLRMDTVSQINALKEATMAGILAPNEGRAKLGYPAVEGGDSPYLQQQNYSLAALNKRDSQEDPFNKPAPAAPAPAPAPPQEGGTNEPSSDEQVSRAADSLLRRARAFA